MKNFLAAKKRDAKRRIFQQLKNEMLIEDVSTLRVETEALMKQSLRQEGDLSLHPITPICTHTHLTLRMTRLPVPGLPADGE